MTKQEDRGKQIAEGYFSAGISLIIYFDVVFLAQSSKFPETEFRTLLFLTGVVFVITVILSFIWKRKSK